MTFIALASSDSLGESDMAEQLPEWTRTKWASLAQERTLELSTRMNPFVWRGDFDGDSRTDVALFVRSMPSQKEGIAIIFRKETDAIVIGAGTAFGNGGDDFSWLDLWTVAEAGDASADRLYVATNESASAVIVFRARKPIWQEQGD
jgi:hypothetical protein